MAGYGLSSLVRPLVALAQAPAHVLLVRIADRVGKGVRSAPRDVLLSEATSPSERGRAFGFHRAMDHAGAMLGPLLASAVLMVTNDLRTVFALAALPGALAMIMLVFGVREPERRAGAGADPPDASKPVVAARPRLPSSFKRYLLVLAVFNLGNSSDAFLLLRAQEAGVTLALVPPLWALHHLVKASLSTHAGALSDRWGRRNAILAGWAVYALAYAGFALVSSPGFVVLLFLLYGLFAALTEGAERALVADLAGAEARGRAFGLFHGVTGVMLLPASVLAGGLWQRAGPGVALAVGAFLAAVAAVGLWTWVPETSAGAAS